MERSAALYDLFWENSKFGALTARSFARRLDEFVVSDEGRDQLVYPGSDIALARPRDRLARLSAARRSHREFSAAPLDLRALGRLLAPFAAGGDGSRTFPSAGGLYPLEVFCLLENVAEGPGRVAVHYNADNHSLSVVGQLPAFADYADALGLEGFSGVPHVVVVFVILPERITAKYGERGGRFALIEVGHAGQGLALRLAQERLVGCELGGLFDDRVRGLLGLQGTRAQMALGYACGATPARRIWARERLKGK